MSDFFKGNRIFVGIILGALYGFIYPNMDPEFNPFCAKLNPNMSNSCIYIEQAIYAAIFYGLVANKTENDKQAIRRMALGGFIGGVIGYFMLLPIAAPSSNLAWWFSTGALIGLAYRWAFKGALIGMSLGLVVGIGTLFIEGLIGIKLREVMIWLVIGGLWGATGGASLWPFSKTPSSSRRHSRKDGY